MDDLTALREFGSQLAPEDLEPPADLRSRVLAQASVPRLAWYRRHARPLALLGAAAATVVAIAGPAVYADRKHTGQPSTPHITEAPDEKTGNSGEDCTAGMSYPEEPEDMTDLLYLPPASLTGPTEESPRFALDVADCTPPTTGATWYSLNAEGRVDKRLNVIGPDEINVYEQGTGAATNAAKSTVDIQGQQGLLYYQADERFSRLYWTMPDGTHWKVEGEGMKPAQLVSAVNSIVIDTGTVKNEVIPTGLTDIVAPQQIPSSLKAGMSATFHFGPHGSQKTSVELTLSTVEIARTGAAIGSRSVDINGTTGWVTRRDSNGQVLLTWSPRTGVRASMIVKGTPGQAIELARATRPADLSDARLGQ